MFALLPHKGCRIMPPVYSALLQGVWYWCTEVLGGTFFTALPGFSLPYQVAPASLVSSWAGRHSLRHADRTLKCCQGMLNSFAGWNVPPASHRHGFCWSTHVCLPPTKALQSLTPTFLFILEPSCPEAVVSGSVLIPHSSSSLCTWWVAHFCMHSGTKLYFSDTMMLQEDQAEPSELSGRRQHLRPSEGQDLADTQMKRMTNYLLRQGQGSLNPFIFMCFSKPLKVTFFPHLDGRWECTGRDKRDSAVEITH